MHESKRQPTTIAVPAETRTFTAKVGQSLNVPLRAVVTLVEVLRGSGKRVILDVTASAVDWDELDAAIAKGTVPPSILRSARDASA